MCGIAGFVDWRDGLSLASKVDVLQQMQTLMRHRGPDGNGHMVSTNRKVGLAHTRLSIVDLSETGHQPMSSDDRKTHLVFNGEIYNHQEMRVALEAEGVRFMGTSDSEVLLHWLRLYGAERLDAVDGMFAFCFYDERRNSLLLARDPMGEKPLYFVHRAQDIFAFASETKALLGTSLSEGRMCANGLYSLLRQGSIPPPYTHIEDIHFLKPGHLLDIDLSSQKVSVRAYWKHPFHSEYDPKIMSDEESAVELESVIKRSFKRRLRADVPVGAFLSGGIDSTYVCARLLEAGAKDLNTFTVVMPNQPGDESEYAKEISRRLGTSHHEIAIDFKEDQDWLCHALDDMDVPSIDGANTWLVSRAVAQHGFKVACSGVGGDELFYGYPSFALAEKTRWLSQSLSKVSRPFGKGLAPVLSRLTQHPKGLRVVDAFQEGMDVASLWFSKRAVFSEKEVFQFISEVMREKVDATKSIHRARGLLCATDSYPLRKVSALEQQVYMHDQLLRDTDTMSMAHSLEVRLPLIGKEIVETVAQISPAWLWKSGPKWVLKDWLSHNGFEGFFDRPKQGFTLNWNAILPDYLERHWPVIRSDSLMTAQVNRELKRFMKGQRQYARSYSLLSAQIKMKEKKL